MQKYQDAVFRLDGRPAPGAVVTVTNYQSGTPATIYRDNGVTQYPANTITADASGEYYFYAANGRYTLSVSYSGFTGESRQDVILYDPEAADAITNSQASVVLYGADKTGSSDSSAAFNAAAASGKKVIDARGGTFLLQSTVNIASGQVWLLAGSTFNFTGTSSTMWRANDVDNWAMIGPFTINGDLVFDPGTGVTSKAIHITDCGNWRVDEPTINAVNGYGIYLEPGSSTRARGNGGVISNPTLNACVWGWHDTPGSGAEYCTVHNVRATGNAQAGVETAAGNIIWIGGHIVDNIRDGVRVFNGSNHAHGMFFGANINHNSQYNVMTSQVMNGQDFIGCHIYGNGASTGAIFLDRSKGIHFDGGHLDCHLYNYKDGSSGINVIEGMYCPGSSGVTRLAGSNNGHDQLLIRNLYGPGAVAASGGFESAGVPLNDPAPCYVLAQRDAGSTQSLTSGAAAALTFSATPPFPDRRGAMNMGTGTFTVPANLAGVYRIDVNCLFGGSSMSASSSFIELKVNGTTKRVLFSNAYSTSRVQVQGSTDIVLAAGDAVTFVATIVGTTPSFGDATWPSSVRISLVT